MKTRTISRTPTETVQDEEKPKINKSTDLASRYVKKGKKSFVRIKMGDPNRIERK